MLNALFLTLLINVCNVDHIGSSILTFVHQESSGNHQFNPLSRQLKGRVFLKEKSTAPEEYISVQEIKDMVLVAYLPSLDQYALIKTDDEGEYKIPIPLSAIYQRRKDQAQVIDETLEIYALLDEKSDMLDHLEKLYDRAPINFDDTIINGFMNQYLSTAFCQVSSQQIKIIKIQPTDRYFALRSDIDLTYLDTDFHSTSALLDLLESKSEQRKTILKMDLILKTLQLNPLNSLTFISGSPTFFEIHLKKKLQIDGVKEDELFLKDFKGIIQNTNPFKWVSALKAQVPYKLEILFRQRQTLLPQTQEILFGDDSESDYIVYQLYARFLAQQLNLQGLKQALLQFEVNEEQTNRILTLAQESLKYVSQEAGFVAIPRIYIHQTSKPNLKYPIAQYLIPQMVLHQHESQIILDLKAQKLITDDQFKAFCLAYLPQIKNNPSLLFRQKEVQDLCMP